jgi:hypothetical protein
MRDGGTGLSAVFSLLVRFLIIIRSRGFEGYGGLGAVRPRHFGRPPLGSPPDGSILAYAGLQFLG